MSPPAESGFLSLEIGSPLGVPEAQDTPTLPNGSAGLHKTSAAVPPHAAQKQEKFPLSTYRWDA